MRRLLTAQISHVHFFMVIIGHITWTCHYECKKHLMIIKDNLMTIDYKLIAISNEKSPPSVPPCPPGPLAVVCPGRRGSSVVLASCLVDCGGRPNPR